MSGLETAIRNALDRSDRADREIRARIYQSARQALDAGLRKQGVADRLIVMQQHEMLERKIHEIEMEEVGRISAPPPEDGLDFAPDLSGPVGSMQVEAPSIDNRPHTLANPPSDMALGGATRSASATASQAAPPVAPVVSQAIPVSTEPVVDFGDVSVDRSEQMDLDRPDPRAKGNAGKPLREAKRPKPAKTKGKAAAYSASGTMLNVPPERAAKPRKRRGFLSHLLTWVITLGVVGGACWWFYQSGMVQSFIEETLNAEQAAGGGGATPFDPRRAFSDDWQEVFVPSKLAELKAGAQARVEAVSASEGQAVRIVSAVPDAAGDVAIDVPTEILREMAGKSSTVALTLQSGQNRTTQLSVRCDFGSLGTCSRHRFTASQEKQDALFRVSFDRTLAPNRPGRLILNSGIEGADRPILLYSVRILPGQ